MNTKSVQTAAAITFIAARAVAASDQPAEPVAPQLAPTTAASEGLLPIPDYTGDIWTRRALLGDLNGGRTGLANKGIQFGIDWNQTLQSVVSGGRDESTAYGGTLDYNLTLDLMRMGVLPGALIKLRGESRYGESANADVAQILPANTDHFMPLTGELEDELPFALTSLTYFQYLSKSFGIFLGKFDTFDGDPNEFASGRGLTQFQNLNLLFSPALLVTVPYSTLGGGLLWNIVPNITVTSSVFTTADSSTTTGFDKIGDGWTWSSEAQFQYRLGHLPGGVNIGGAYAWGQDFATVGRRFVFTPGEGISRTSDQSDSWGIYASVWQYLFSDEPAEASDAALNLLDGAPDRKGLGIFARVGFADEDTNPLEYTISGGLGGRGLLPGRDHDLAGIGVFYSQFRSRRLISALGIDESTQGLEVFYNIALTPAAGLSFDVQVLEPSNERRDTAVLVGARLLLRF